MSPDSEAAPESAVDTLARAKSADASSGNELSVTQAVAQDAAPDRTAELPQAAGEADGAIESKDVNAGESPDESSDQLAAATEEAQPPAPADEKKPIKRSGRTTDITFDDLNTEMPEDAKWDPKFLTDRIKELDGKTVKIAGFMLADFRTKGITEFVMLKNTECKFGPGGSAHHVMMVYLGSEEGTRYTTRAVTVEGVLMLKPWEGPDGNTWALYELRDGVVR